MMSDEANNSQIIIYKDVNGKTKIDVRFGGDTVWLTQKMLGSLYNVDVQTISEHIHNILKSGELKNSQNY